MDNKTKIIIALSLFILLISMILVGVIFFSLKKIKEKELINEKPIKDFAEEKKIVLQEDSDRKKPLLKLQVDRGAVQETISEQTTSQSRLIVHETEEIKTEEISSSTTKTKKKILKFEDFSRKVDIFMTRGENKYTLINNLYKAACQLDKTAENISINLLHKQVKNNFTEIYKILNNINSKKEAISAILECVEGYLKDMEVYSQSGNTINTRMILINLQNYIENTLECMDKFINKLNDDINKYDNQYIDKFEEIYDKHYKKKISKISSKKNKVVNTISEIEKYYTKNSTRIVSEENKIKFLQRKDEIIAKLQSPTTVVKTDYRAGERNTKPTASII